MSGSKDLSVDWVGSPISLDKFLKTEYAKFESEQKLTVLIDGSGSGIFNDTKSHITISPEECHKQAKYYSEKVFNGKAIPLYLYRHLCYMMLDKEYQTNEEIYEDFRTGRVTKDSEHYKQLVNLIKYCSANPEAMQVIGLIQLISGCLNIAREHKSKVGLYIQHPEAHLHPKRQSKFMTMFNELLKEYGE